MISENLKKVAADSNVILSAVIGKAALQIFLLPEINFITTDFNLLEVEEYLPRLASKYTLDEKLVQWQFKMLPIEGFSEKYYRNYLPQAAQLLGQRDPDDVHLAALALKEDIPIWSNDRDFEKLPVSVYTTSKLLKILKND
ncbi:MAG: PIN domain nuclease [Candidatus Omnitrophica bacterium]|nr:PIN domain nuclease [Candidatus Omnitrophota bacterium]